MTEKYFPQVGDNELMLTEMPHMNLYDETDLISNITGDYVDKNYLEWQPIAENTKPKHPYHQPLEEPLPKRRPVRKPDFKEPIDKKSPANRYAEEARERAREDLKKKRIQQLPQVSGKNRLFQNENLVSQQLPSKRKTQVNY